MARSIALGLMSGTSLDGVDVALVDTDGERIFALGPVGFQPYAGTERALLRTALERAETLKRRTDRPAAIAAAEAMVTDAHARAVERFLADHTAYADRIDVVGFHGQTVLHRPEQALTVQIGDGAALAARLGLPVVYDLRAADMAAGGQGAPMVPVFHRAMVGALGKPGPVAVLNVGGVANVTVIDGARDPVACDTGPGNALIDDFMQARVGLPMDRDGVAAAAGMADAAIVDWVLSNPFFDARYPKSLDRNAFAYAQVGLSALSVEDGAATLTALTAAAVAKVVAHLPQTPRTWIVAGGGARNVTLMRMLAERLAPAAVLTAGEVGWSADALEAQAFAYLAVRRLRGLPSSFPTTTGVRAPQVGGVFAAAPSAREKATASQRR